MRHVSGRWTRAALCVLVATAGVSGVPAGDRPDPRTLHASRPERAGITDPRSLAVAKPSDAGTPRLIPNVFPESVEIPRGDERPLDWPQPAGGLIHVAVPEAGATAAAPPLIDVRFDGPFDGGVAPPDCVLAVGRDQVVSLINLQIAMYDKAGHLVQGPLGLASFFGIPAAFGVFDPLAVYDPFAGRFIVSVLADRGATQDSRLYVAFSQTGDPTGLWNRYWIDADAGQAGNWADYSSVGLDRFAVYFTANMFVRGGGYANVTVFAYSKDDGEAGLPLRNTHLIDVRTEANGSPYRLRPAYVPEAVPGDEYYFAHTDSSFGDRVNLWRLTGDRFGSPVLAASSVTLPGTFLTPGKARQPASTKKIDTLGSNLWNVWYRGGKLFTAQAVSGSQGTAAWVHRVAVSSNPAVREQTYSIEVTGKDTYFPYVVPDAADDDFAVLSAFSGPTLYVTGRYWNVDAAGTVRSAELLADATVANTSQRHGDYFAVGTDPRDRNRVWMIAQFMRDSSFAGNTAIASVRFEEIPPPSTPPPVPDGQSVPGRELTVDRASGGQVTVSWDATLCPAPGNHLIWYDLASLASYAVAAENCAAGNAGWWTGTPPSIDVAVLAVSDDASTTEGSHGVDSAGAERPSRSAACGFAQKVTSGTCP